jgi:hypothetical protein
MQRRSKRLIPYAGAELSDPLIGSNPDHRRGRKPRLPKYLVRLRDILHEVPPKRRPLIAAALLERCRNEASRHV